MESGASVDITAQMALLRSTAEALEKNLEHLNQSMPRLCNIYHNISKCKRSISTISRMITKWHRTDSSIVERLSILTNTSDVPCSMETQDWILCRPPSQGRLSFWQDAVEQPSPPLLTVKWFSFALLGLAIHHSRRQDRYQNHFILAGIGCTGLIAIHLPQDTMVCIQMYLPFGMIFALLFSAMVHWLVRNMNAMRREQHQRSLQRVIEGTNPEKTRRREDFGSWEMG